MAPDWWQAARHLLKQYTAATEITLTRTRTHITQQRTFHVDPDGHMVSFGRPKVGPTLLTAKELDESPGEWYRTYRYGGTNPMHEDETRPIHTDPTDRCHKIGST